MPYDAEGKFHGETGIRGHREIQLAAGRRQQAEDSRLRLMASARQGGQKSLIVLP